MSRESLLDEAIAKAKEAEDWQLVEWLRMARGGESATRWYSDKLREAHRTERKLLDENAKLRELVNDCFGLLIRYCATVEDRRCEFDCGFWHGYGEGQGCELWGIEDRMRDLGMEVD